MKPLAVITGAASGIGRGSGESTGKGAIRFGARRTKTPTALSATAGEIISQTPQCHIHCEPADLTKPQDRTAVLNAIASSDANDILLINNAGISHFGTLASNEDTNLEMLFATNVLAPMAPHAAIRK